MLDYFKLILSKVCFDRRLFWKEFKKSKQWLAPHETEELKSWLRKNKLLPSNQVQAN